MSKSLSRYCKYMNLDNLLWNMNFIFILGSINSAQRFVFEKSQNYWVVFLQFLHPLRSAMIHYEFRHFHTYVSLNFTFLWVISQPLVKLLKFAWVSWLTLLIWVPHKPWISLLILMLLRRLDWRINLRFSLVLCGINACYFGTEHLMWWPLYNIDLQFPPKFMLILLYGYHSFLKSFHWNIFRML